MQRVGALVYGLGADEPTCTPLVTPLSIILQNIPGPATTKFENAVCSIHILSLVPQPTCIPLYQYGVVQF